MLISNKNRYIKFVKGFSKKVKRIIIQDDRMFDIPLNPATNSVAVILVEINKKLNLPADIRTLENGI